MPTRIVREGILDSDAVNQLSDRAEIFYRRLMSVVDDYGRFDGRLAFLRVRVFPLQLDRWPLVDVEEALEECGSILLSSGEPLVTAYEVEGKPYVQINNFGQRVRSASKFPAPDGLQASVPSGKVYFIWATESKRIKIGYTEWKPESRMGSLQVGMPEKLELLGWMEGSRADEAMIQRQFAHLQSVGEWFDDHADLRAFIDDKAQCRTMPHNAAQVVATRGRGRSEAEAETESYTSSNDDDGASDDGGSFETWYQTYPRKVGKVPGRKAFHAVIVKGRLPAGAVAEDMDGLKGPDARFERLMDTSAAWNAEFASRDADKRPHPATFINSLNWIKAPEATAAAKPKLRRSWE